MSAVANATEKNEGRIPITPDNMKAHLATCCSTKVEAYGYSFLSDSETSDIKFEKGLHCQYCTELYENASDLNSKCELITCNMLCLLPKLKVLGKLTSAGKKLQRITCNTLNYFEETMSSLDFKEMLVATSHPACVNLLKTDPKWCSIS